MMSDTSDNDNLNKNKKKLRRNKNSFLKKIEMKFLRI